MDMYLEGGEGREERGRGRGRGREREREREGGRKEGGREREREREGEREEEREREGRREGGWVPKCAHCVHLKELIGICFAVSAGLCMDICLAICWVWSAAAQDERDQLTNYIDIYM